MSRFLRRTWLQITAWLMMPFMLVTCDAFYANVFAASSPQDEPEPPAISAAPRYLAKRIDEIVRNLRQTPVDTAALQNLANALDALKPQLDADIDAAGADSIREAFETRFETLRNHLDAVIADPATAPAALAYVLSLQPAESSFLNADLPHGSTPLLAAPLRPIGGTPVSGPPTPSDVAETPETALTPEIVALATELDHNPVRIFEYVRNNFQFEPYYGSVKGAAQTLREGAGNDADLASLTIALFRASDIPARWVQGTIEVSRGDLLSWLGVDHPARALDVLAKNGVPFETLPGAGSYTAVRLDHVWVRAFVDAAPYRGAAALPGDAFVDIDPSFKRLACGEFQDVAAQVGFDAQAFLQSVRARPGTVVGTDSVRGVDENFIFSTLQGVGAKVDNLVSAAGVPASQAFRTSKIEAETLGVLPASRPYAVAAEGGAYAELPSAFRTYMKVEVFRPDGASDIDFDVATLQAAGRSLTLSYKGATTTDEAAIAAHKADADFPAFLVNLKPVLTLEGQAPIEGSSLGMGTLQNLRVTFASPFGSRSSEVRRAITTGTYTALVIDLSKKTARELDERRANKLEAPDASEDEILHSVGVNYFFQADRLNDISANALGVTVQREPSLAIVTHQISVTTLLGLPFTARADAVSIDVARDVLIPVATGSSRAPEKQFLLTSGFTASALEQTSLVSFFGSDAVSTVRAIVKANALGQDVYTIDASNVALADTLSHPQAVIDDVKNAAQAGFTITIPASTVPLGSRAVSAFIVLDPLLASSAFIIKASPFLAGGLTLTEQIKAGELLTLGTGYQPILSAGAAWFRSAAAATDQAGLEYIPAIAAINQWPMPDRLTTVASSIAISAPLNFVANLPGIFNVASSPAVISPALLNALTISATVTRGAPWTVKVFHLGDPAPVATYSGTDPALSVSFGNVVPDGDYSFRIEATDATPRGGVFKVDSTPPVAVIAALPEPLTGLVGIRGTANDANFQSYRVEILPESVLLTEKDAPRIDSVLAPWNTAPIESGNRTIRLTVQDEAGNVSTVERIVAVSNPPQDIQAPQVAITAPASGATVTDLVTVTASASDAPPGSIAEVQLFVDGIVAGFDANAPYEFLLPTTALANGAHALVARARDTAGFLTDSAPVTVTASNTIQSFRVAPNPFSPRTTPGVQDTATALAEIPDGAPYTLELRVIEGGIAEVSGGGTVTFLELPQGTILRTFTGVGPFVEVPWDGRNDAGFMVLEAADLPGLAGTYEVRLTSGAQTASLVLLTTAANPAPIVQIAGPDRFGDVKGKVPVVGTVKDLGDDLASYTVKLVRQGETDGPVIGSGTAPVENGPLAAVDPTLLENDFYEIRVSAVDSLGQIVTLAREINVVGEQKVGIFTLTFQDLAVPVQGIPISITRTYDTRLGEGRDFGYGWRLDVVAGSVKVRANNDVMVTLPDNRRARFSFAPLGGTEELNAFTQGLLGGGAPQVFSPFKTARYEPEATVPRWSLRALGDQDLLAIPTEVRTVETAFGPVSQVVNSGLYYYDFTPFNPPGYVVADQRGMEFEYAAEDGGRLRFVREPNGNSLAVTDTAIIHSTGKQVQIVRDAGGKVQRLVDPDGKEVRYEYVGQLAASVDREDNRTQYIYQDTRLEKVLDPRGIQAVKNEYDTDGRLLAHTDAEGNRIVFAHDVDGRQEVVTDRRGNLTVYVYNDDGNVVSQTNALGYTRSFDYDAAGNQTLERDELGNETISTYDGRGNLLTRTDPLGNVTTFVYNDLGQVTETTDPLGHKTLNEYDTEGNLIATTDAAGNRTVNEYDGMGRLVAVTDVLGTRTEFDPDGFGNVNEQRVLSAEGELLRKSTFTFDVLGRQRTQTAWKDNVAYATTETIYNANDQVAESKDALGHSSFTTYNDIGQQETVTDKLGNVTTFIYNDRGLLETTVYPELDGANPTEVVTYDVEGNRETFLDRNGRLTRTEYDKLNRPYKSFNSDESFRITTYDPAGRVVAETDERGFSTVFGYDDAGRRISVTDPLGNETKFEFDAAGRQEAMTDALEHRTEFEFDVLGRQIRTLFPDGTSRSVEYDVLGRRVAETDEASLTTRFAYAPTGELLSVEQPDSVVTSYGFDTLGRKVTQTDALGRVTSFEYNVRNEMTLRTRPMGETEGFAYDVQGNMKTRTDGMGRVTEFEYNALNMLSSKTFPDSSVEGFAYYPGGQRKSYTIGGQTTSFGLDGRNRLASQTNPDGTLLEWSYDVAGNRTAVKTAFQTISYTYTPRNELFQVLRGDTEWARYSYDKVGNRESVAYVNGTVQRLTYNSKNQLKKIENVRTRLGTSNTNYLADPNLVSAWRLDENSTPYADTKLANPLTAQGTDTASASGGVHFGDTSQAYLATETPSPLDTRPFPSPQGTLVLNYQPDTAAITGNPAELFSTRQDNSWPSSRTHFRRNTDGSLEMIDTGYGRRSGALTWDTSRSQAVSFRWSPAGSQIFRDGAQIFTSTINPMYAPDTTVNRYFLGNIATAPEQGQAYGARGTLDEVALFSRPLTNDEIADIAARGLEPKIEVVFSSYEYTVDDRGLRTKVVEQTGRQVEYTYDNLRRLTEEKITESGQVTVISYTLDVVGNRIEKRIAKPSGPVDLTIYTYNANDELETENGPDGIFTYTYNNNGETTQKNTPAGSVLYSWDYEGRMVGTLTSGETLSFTYDADGIRSSKTVNGAITRFLVDKNRDYAQVLEERDAAGTVGVAYIYGDDLISQERAGGAFSFYHYDGQLSARHLTDAAATVTDSYTYDAFGVMLAQTGATPNNYLYTGEQYDPNVGFYYVRARYLIQNVGRFLSLDPSHGVDGDPGTLHKYLFAKASPVTNHDPTGQFSVLNILAGVSIALTITSFGLKAYGAALSYRALSEVQDGLRILSDLPLDAVSAELLRIYLINVGIALIGQLAGVALSILQDAVEGFVAFVIIGVAIAAVVASVARVATRIRFLTRLARGTQHTLELDRAAGRGVSMDEILALQRKLEDRWPGQMAALESSGQVLGMARKADIRQIDRIVRELRLTKGQRRILHDMITKEGYSVEEIVEIAKHVKGSYPGK